MGDIKTVAVISAYNNSIKWSLKLLQEKIVDKIYVYSHKDITNINPFVLNNDFFYEEIPNKGCEASSYLKYIIDNYDNLPDKIILLHDHEFSWHHDGSIIEVIKNNIDKNKDYINLNSYVWNNNEWDKSRDNNFFILYKRFLEPYYGNINLFLNFKEGHKGCAQFILHKNRIKRNSYKFYLDLYNYCMDECQDYGHVEKGFGYFMEFVWHIIFGHIVPIKQSMEGSWKYSSRFVTMNNNSILCDLRKKNGEWLSVHFPIKYENIIYNNNGFPRRNKK
jgi:hypothetical protein